MWSPVYPSHDGKEIEPQRRGDAEDEKWSQMNTDEPR
jgi:hypothetical protein